MILVAINTAMLIPIRLISMLIRITGRNSKPKFSLFPSSQLEGDPHHQQTALQYPCNKIDSPRTPSLPPKSRCQTPHPHKASRRLYTHHRYTQTAHLLQLPRRPYLRQELYSGQTGAENTEKVCPRGEVRTVKVNDDDRQKEREDQVNYGDQEDYYGKAVGGFIFGLGVRGCAREE